MQFPLSVFIKFHIVTFISCMTLS